MIVLNQSVYPFDASKLQQLLSRCEIAEEGTQQSYQVQTGRSLHTEWCLKSPCGTLCPHHAINFETLINQSHRACVASGVFISNIVMIVCIEAIGRNFSPVCFIRG
jgi:hypothetical protein